MQGKILGGRYRIIRQLACGGFGHTFVAVDTHLPGRPQCVLKHLKPQTTDESALRTARRLFKQEAEVLYELGNHPQIPQLFGHFEQEREFYLVQEFIQGHELRQELPVGQQKSEEQVIAILREILQILVFVHQEGVIHRDIKPSNLIRRRQDGKIVLIDFGAVKKIKTGVINSQGGTSLTIAVGTPEYMPSEQREGKPRFSSDIYAVGMLGILALTGLRRSQLPDDLNTGEIVWRDRVQVSPELADILDKMVLYDFRQRYQSAAQVLEALNSVALKKFTPTHNILVLAGDHNPHSLRTLPIVSDDFSTNVGLDTTRLRKRNPHSRTTTPIVSDDFSTNLGLDKTRLSDLSATARENWKEADPPKKLPIWSSSRLQKVLLASRRCLQVLAASVVVTGLTMGVRHLGMLQTWELQAYDQMMRTRPDEGQDSRLLVVTITEEDFGLPEQQQRKGSLSDRALALLLQKLEHYQPRAIGLDIYRDFPADSKQPELATRMQQYDNFFAICKVTQPQVNQRGISPPPEIPIRRQGFSDFATDPDGILRRHLIAMNPGNASRCTTPYALSAQLAFRYLQAEKGISAKYTQQKELQLGNVVFKRLRSHMGGYQKIDDAGYQILLNYRSHHSPQEFVKTVRLKDVLTGKVEPDALKDRIVLIGVTAESVHDYVPTPYSAGQASFQEMPGVIAHAQMVSQILSAVIDGRPLLWVWPLWGEVLWVWSWSVVGGVLAWRLRSIRLVGLAGVAATGVLCGLCFGCFITIGGWLPLIPSALALVVTGGSMVASTPSQTQRQHYTRTLVSHN